MLTLDIDSPNAAWIFHREEIELSRDGSCNVYFLIDGFSGFVFNQYAVRECLSKSKTLSILKTAYKKAGCWPKRVLISGKDPYVEPLSAYAKEVDLDLECVTPRELKPHIKELHDLFLSFKRGDESRPSYTALERAEIEAFIPGTYDPCPCASGKKYKFCCKPIFVETSEAMCAAEEGDLDQALEFMRNAEQKVGQTAEVLCRYAICWSFYDAEEADKYLNEALKVNENHPRANYVLALDAVGKGDDATAIHFYQKAIEHYPKTDRYHLNEAYNNLGSAFYRRGEFEAAKGAWEKGLVLLPIDKTIFDNLLECIYTNPELPKDLRTVSPYIEKYLGRYFDEMELSA